MRKIYKYKLASIDSQEITMPSDAVFLSVQTQYGNPCLWVLVDPESKPKNRIILIFGTGHQVHQANIHFIDTYQVQVLDGDLVFHVFEQL